MAITAVNLFNTAPAASGDVNFTTSNITWVTGRLYVAIITINEINNGAGVQSISRTGITWTNRLIHNGNNYGTYVYTGVCTSGSTAGLTVNIENRFCNVGVIVDEISGIDTVATVVQNTNLSSASGTTTVTLGAFSSANNGTYALAFAQNTSVASVTITKEAAWTQLAAPTNHPSANTRNHTTAYLPTNDTTATFTFNTGASPTVRVWAMEVKGLAASTNSPILIFCGM